MPDVITKLAQLIDPEVMAEMISAKLPKMIRVAPIAKVDTTLVGVPGDTVTVPAYGYIGDAEDVAEGVDVTITAMSTTTKQAKVKKAMKGVSLTDEAVMSSYGNPVGEAANQLTISIAAKVDNDCMDALQDATLIYDGSAAKVSYNGIVDAIDKFEEEFNSEKVMYIHPDQMTTLRKDSQFISADKYEAGVAVSGEVGKIANTRIVVSKKVPVVDFGAKEASGGQAAVAGVPCYACPIVKMEAEDETEDSTPALTIYLKRDTNLEVERKAKNRTTEITVDKNYVAVLSNESKVVLANFKK